MKKHFGKDSRKSDISTKYLTVALMRFSLTVFLAIETFAAEPPREIPTHLVSDYTLGGAVPIYDYYLDGTCSVSQPTIFLKSEIEEMVQKALQRQTGYYGPTDSYLYEMLDKYASFIEGKRIAIIGSVTPWYEAIILAYGGHPVTIEYQQILCNDPRCQVMTVEEFKKSPSKFDAVLSISSIEHDGLGRYGDPINPWADIETMKKVQEMLEAGGLLFLSIPVGLDALYWNAHRVYGNLRLPMLLEGWQMIDTSGLSYEDLYVCRYNHQPVFVLKSSD